MIKIKEEFLRTSNWLKVKINQSINQSKVCNKRSEKMKERCLGPYTLEHTRPRLAHGSQASDGLVSTGEGDHSGILNVLGFLLFLLFLFYFILFYLFYFPFLILFILLLSLFLCFFFSFASPFP